MASKKKNSKIREKINEIYEENELANLLANKNRARSITVGTAFGGVVEVSMRGDYHDLWVTLQPVEVVELIEQLASGVGLQIAMRPRQDFATWRGWNVEARDRYWAGAADWQIEQSSTNHRRMLEIEKKARSLPESTEKDSQQFIPAEEEYKKSMEEQKIQQDVKDELYKPAMENIKNIRKDVKKVQEKRTSRKV